jgi:polysaccharide pyruvyl transferase WcaK-like protein
MYPRTYPLASNLDDIKVPIVIMGSGWYGVPGDDATLEQYRFNASTKGMFEKIRRQGSNIGVRDYLTESALKNNGITNVTMTGCPSWYDLEHLDDDFEAPAAIKTVVFTPPARRIFQGQAVQVMKVLPRLFPWARLVCSFHRGIEADEQTPQEDARWMGQLALTAGELGYEVMDTSYGLEKVSFYEECDLHVGYRVHGHIYFLAKRKPSFLIHEDGRGRGTSEALGLPGIQGWERTLAGKVAAKVREPHFSTLLGTRALDMRARKVTVDELEGYIKDELESGFDSFRHLPQTIRHHYQSMVEFLNTIP